MAAEEKPAPAGAPPGKGPNPPVALNSPASPGDPRNTPHAAATAVKHGGLKGGRRRDDGLVPGSKEAVAADRERDAERKRRERDARRGDPPALPSASVPGNNQA